MTISNPTRALGTIGLAVALTACASGGSSPEPATPAAEPGPASEAAATTASADAASGPTSVLDGVYLQSEAEAGSGLFRRVCADCHSTREFRGADFLLSWEGSDVGRFYDMVSTNMPEDAPGSLSDEQYRSVVSYILSLNGYPAGAAPLPADFQAMRAIKIVRAPDA